MLVRLPLDEPEDTDRCYPEVLEFEVVPSVLSELASYLYSFKRIKDDMQKEGWDELHEILIATYLHQCALYRDPETEELVEWDALDDRSCAVCIDDFDLVIRGKNFLFRGYGGDHMVLESRCFTLNEIREAFKRGLEVYDAPYVGEPVTS